jgi:hypothetical protein
VRRGGVGSRILEDLEAGTVLGDGGQDVEQVVRRPDQTVEAVAANWMLRWLATYRIRQI